MPPRRDAGQTLLELAVVLGMVALAAGLLLPRLGALGRWRVERAAERLAAALTLAQERAILAGTPVRMEVDLDRGRWRVGRDAPRALSFDVRLRAARVGDAAEARSGRVMLTLDPAGDGPPVRFDLTDERGHAVRVVLPPAGARARVVREGPA